MISGMARVAPEKADFAPALPISLRAATCEVVCLTNSLPLHGKQIFPLPPKLFLLAWQIRQTITAIAGHLSRRYADELVFQKGRFLISFRFCKTKVF
jgi:hypothetical protein